MSETSAELTFKMLLEACSPGGASNLSVTTELEPAAGLHAGVAPARYVRGNKGTYAYEGSPSDASFSKVRAGS